MTDLKSFFEGKIVLITGHTGFKGSWLSLWLTYLGAKVVGVSKDIPTEPSNFTASSLKTEIDDRRLDILNFDDINNLVNEIKPDYVFHLAAQALVRSSYKYPLQTLLTNSIGTTNILESLRKQSKKVNVVMITSDKVYDNLEWPWGYRETDRLGGKDPYSASKAMAEMAIRTYVESYFKLQTNVNLGVARAGNVIGGGDWAKDRIVPDCIKAWSVNKIVEIRNPIATRPWQHVLEPLSGYLSLAVNLSNNPEINGQSYNFGPDGNQNYSVKNLIENMSQFWANVRWNDVSNNKKYFHEAGLLKLNCDKALNDLNWLPTLKFGETVQMTIEWYKEYYQNADKFNNSNMFEFSVSQIKEYHKLATKRNLSWAKTLD